MKPGIRYVVTKAKNGREFQVGDRFSLQPDGSINNIMARGWIEPENVEEATDGMEYEVDREWARSKVESLRKEADAIEETYGKIS